MPWCDDCARFWSPNSVAEDGTCPTCGRSLGAPRSARGPTGAAADDPTAGMGPDEIDTRIPWHFWVMVAALCVYLGWRLVQGVAWLVG